MKNKIRFIGIIILIIALSVAVYSDDAGPQMHNEVVQQVGEIIKIEMFDKTAPIAKQIEECII